VTRRRLGVGAALVLGEVVRGDVAVEDGAVVELGLPPAGSDLAVPGLIDLQVNGYAGIEAGSASVGELEEMGRALARDGVLAYQPTLISDDPGEMLAALARLGELARRRGRRGAGAPSAAQAGFERGRGGGAHVLGVHVEGPFLARERAGAHPLGRLIAPDRTLAEAMLAAAPVSMVTLAPELPGGIELVSLLAAAGVVVSLGHSSADAEQARRAVAAGATAVTHLFNAMAPVSARAPGLAAAALDDRRVHVQIIADGVHVAGELVRLAFAAAGERCSLVTDCTRLAGLGAGRDRGGAPLVSDGSAARRPDGTIAGGVFSLLHCVRNLTGWSVGLEEALAAVTARPAAVLGRDDVGVLRPGGPADLVVLDDNLELRSVILEGCPLG